MSLSCKVPLRSVRSLPGCPRKSITTTPHVQTGSRRQFSQIRRQDQLSLSLVARATKDEEKFIEQMKQEAAKGDLWESEFSNIAFKILLVSMAVGVTVFIVYLGRPVIDGTIAAFPVNRG